jgi:broad specificity phosphatase PhoE
VDAWNKNIRKNVMMKLKNKYYIMRHAQALSNVRAICSCWPEKFHNPLTILGREIVRESAEKLKAKLDLEGQSIDLIFCSPLLRTEQTAKITGKILGVKPKTDKRLREIGFGIFNSGSLEKMWKHFETEEERIRQSPPKGETYVEILDRMMSFLKDTDKKYKDRNILVISHEGPLFLLQGKVMGFDLKETIKEFPLEKRIHKGEIRELN